MSRSSIINKIGPFLIVALLGGSISAQLPQNAVQEDPKEDTAKAATPDIDSQLRTSLESPRATLKTFIDALNEGKLNEAAKCLDLSGSEGKALASRGPGYAYRLKEIIDRMAYIEWEDVSDEPDWYEPYSIAVLANDLEGQDQKDAETIKLVRGEDKLWRFDRETVLAIDQIWERWEAQPKMEGVKSSRGRVPFEVWLEKIFPGGLHKSHFLLPDYQWLCLAALIFLGFIVDLITRQLLHWFAGTWFKLAKGTEGYSEERKLWKPVGLLMQALVWYGGTTLIGLPAFALTVLLLGLKFFAVVTAVWTSFLLIDFLAGYIAKKALRTETKFDDLLVPLVSKSLKTIAACLGVLMCAEAFNLPLTGLLGGLGIGGAAIAFASKDAVANVFGSITVLTDRPFEIGDWVVTDGVEGTVETVGFRSTRIRTFYNSLVTLPNSRLTTAVVDNMGRRRYRRIKTTLSLQYDTPPDKIDAFCEGVRELLRRHPYTRKDYYHVYLNAFSGSSLDVLLYCFVECPDWAVELREKHRLFLDILRLAEELGVSFAFPTRTLHLFQEEHSAAAGEIPEPMSAGQTLAAEIAGPLLSSSQRPGNVEFTGPKSQEREGNS